MSDRPFNVYAKACPSRAAFDAIFSRWGILILGCLSEQPRRFGEIRRAIDGISEKMLAQSLKVLEDEGLVHREVGDEKALRVEYSLTPAGMRIAAGIKDVIVDLYAVMEERSAKG